MLSNLTNDQAQAFTTGNHPHGCKLIRVDIRMRGGGSPGYAVTILENSSGNPGSSLGTLQHPASLPSALQDVQFTASGRPRRSGAPSRLGVTQTQWRTQRY